MECSDKVKVNNIMYISTLYFTLYNFNVQLPGGIIYSLTHKLLY